MLKDPLVTWPSGVFPYDALAAAKITPASSMSQIRDAIYQLIEEGLWTTEAQLAWDELRFVQKRLWVDLFFYPVTIEQLLATLTQTSEQQELELLTKELDAVVKLDLNELQLLVSELESNERNRDPDES